MPVTKQLSTENSHCLQWVKIVLSAPFFPIILGIFTIVFTMQQNSLANIQRMEDQRRSTEYYNNHHSLIHDLLESSFNTVNWMTLILAVLI